MRVLMVVPAAEIVCTGKINAFWVFQKQVPCTQKTAQLGNLLVC